MTPKELIMMWRAYETAHQEYCEQIYRKGGNMAGTPTFEGFIDFLEKGIIAL